MNALIDNVQTIMENGEPAFAVIPFEKFKMICKQLESLTLKNDEVPHEVVGMMVNKEYSAVKAWRVYLRMNQREAAAKIGISQAALSQIEKSDNNHRGTLEKIASAYGIHVEQLEV